MIGRAYGMVAPNDSDSAAVGKYGLRGILRQALYKHDKHLAGMCVLYPTLPHSFTQPTSPLCHGQGGAIASLFDIAAGFMGTETIGPGAFGTTKSIAVRYRAGAPIKGVICMEVQGDFDLETGTAALSGHIYSALPTHLRGNGNGNGNGKKEATITRFASFDAEMVDVPTRVRLRREQHHRRKETAAASKL